MIIDIHAQAPKGVREQNCKDCQYLPVCNLDLGKRVTLLITPAEGREPVDKNTGDRFSQEISKLNIKPPIFNESGETPTIAGAVWTLAFGDRVKGFCTANWPVILRATVRK